MAKSLDIVNGIAIGADAVSIVQYSRSDQAVSSVIIQPVESGGSDPWSAIRPDFVKLIQTAKISGGSAVCSLPAECAVIKHIALDTDESGVTEAIEWELGQQIVGSIEEYVFDYQRFGTTDATARSYLAVAYRQSVVRKLLALLKSAKLSPLVVDLDLFALINVFEANYPDAITAPVIIATAGGGKAKLCLTHGGAFIDFETVDWGENAPAPEDLSSKIQETARRLTGMHSAYASLETLPIFCTGMLFSENEYREAIINPEARIHLLNPFSAVRCRAEIAEHYLPQLCTAVGLALRATEVR